MLGGDGAAIAALTCPYIAPLNRPKAPDISQTIALVRETAATLTAHILGQFEATVEKTG